VQTCWPSSYQVSSRLTPYALPQATDSSAVVAAQAEVEALQEQLRMKEEALSAAQRAATAERDGLAQQLQEAKEEVARLRAGPKKVEQPVTDDVKVGKAPKPCLHVNVNVVPPADSVEGPGDSHQPSRQSPVCVMSAAGRRDSPHSGHPGGAGGSGTEVINAMNKLRSLCIAHLCG
jgi:hypothetical protein